MHNEHCNFKWIAAELYFSFLKDSIGASISSGTHSLASERLTENLQLNQYRTDNNIILYNGNMGFCGWLL